MAGGKAWTPEEDNLLRSLLAEHLGAKFSDIAQMAINRPGGLSYRTPAAISGRLSLITGRSESRLKRQKRTSEDQEEIDRLNETIQQLRAENKRLSDKVETLQGRGKALCWFQINAAKKLDETAKTYIHFFTEETDK